MGTGLGEFATVKLRQALHEHQPMVPEVRVHIRVFVRGHHWRVYRTLACEGPTG